MLGEGDERADERSIAQLVRSEGDSPSGPVSTSPASDAYVEYAYSLVGAYPGPGVPPLLAAPAAPVRRSRKLGPDVPERDRDGPLAEAEEVSQSIVADVSVSIVS